MSRLVLCWSVFVLLFTACGSQEQATQPPAAGGARPEAPAEYAGYANPLAGKADAAEAGMQTYGVYCASCHGESGHGDGPVAASLNPAPTSLAGADLSDAYLYWRIAEGGLKEPFKSAMPSWKNSLDESQIWQVITYIRMFSP